MLLGTVEIEEGVIRMYRTGEGLALVEARPADHPMPWCALYVQIGAMRRRLFGDVAVVLRRDGDRILIERA